MPWGAGGVYPAGKDSGNFHAGEQGAQIHVSVRMKAHLLLGN